MSTNILYTHKQADYFEMPRDNFFHLIEGNNLRVLDIGCGSGLLGKRLLESGTARWVTGIELIPEVAEIAQTRLSEALTGDIEKLPLDQYTATFDAIVCGDVIEHVIDPYGLLDRLRSLLTPGGYIAASIPNVKFLPVVFDLLAHDQWHYRESGVLDLGHLRFFTKTTIIEMFQHAGFSVESITPRFSGRRYSYSDRASLGLLTKYLALGWFVRASVQSDGR